MVLSVYWMSKVKITGQYIRCSAFSSGTGLSPFVPPMTDLMIDENGCSGVYRLGSCLIVMLSGLRLWYIFVFYFSFKRCSPSTRVNVEQQQIILS